MKRIVGAVSDRDPNLKSITLTLASPDDIRKMSGGEVTVDAVLDDTGAPVTGGLFCPLIFGADGRGFGHIELAEPVAHPWYDDGHVLQALPVVPPAMRPLVKGHGGPELSSDLNELYRRVIARNNALKEVLAAGGAAKSAYVSDAKERLADAVRSLIGDSSDGPLQSLTALLTGENGLLRRNLAGKRQDYSGRAVIVSGPDLKMHQCGLPYEMALAQFKPFIARKLVEAGAAESVDEALGKIHSDFGSREVRKAVEQAVSERSVLLNRAPTLHRLGIQPFEPVLVDHKAIALHPLVCYAFSADFDGDQMAAHVPVTASSQREAQELLDSAINLASPANGKPIAGPVQDIVIGLWYLTQLGSGNGEWGMGRPAGEIVGAVESGEMRPHELIVLEDKEFSGVLKVDTTAGRVAFNAALPKELRFVNEQMTRDRLTELVARCLETCGHVRTRSMLDDLNTLGFEHATRYAPSYGLGVAPDPAPVDEIRSKAIQEEHALLDELHAGKIDHETYFNRAWALWSDASERATQALMAVPGPNPIRAMVESGARGSARDLGFSFGIAGPAWREAASGERPVFEAACPTSYWEGIGPIELFARSFASRKGFIDTNVRSMEAFSLMRELIFAGQGVLVTTDDCGETDGMEVRPIEFDGKQLSSLAHRIQGRIAAGDIKDRAGKTIVKRGELISKEQAESIEATGIESARIRTALTCSAGKGVCATCYGEDLATGKMVAVGTAVGVVAAQAMAEPAIQLTYRTYYPSPKPPKPDTPRHPGGLRQMIELFRGQSPKLSATELIEKAQCILGFQGVDVNDKHFEVIARVMYPEGSPTAIGALEAAQRSSSMIGSAAVGDARQILARAALEGASDTFENTLERIVAGLAPRARPSTSA